MQHHRLLRARVGFQRLLHQRQHALQRVRRQFLFLEGGAQLLAFQPGMRDMRGRLGALRLGLLREEGVDAIGREIVQGKGHAASPSAWCGAGDPAADHTARGRPKPCVCWPGRGRRTRPG